MQTLDGWLRLLVCVVALPLIAACGSATAVEDIPTGAEITVRLDDGQVVKGRLVEVQPSTLVVTSALDGRDSTIPRANVVEVEAEASSERAMAEVSEGVPEAEEAEPAPPAEPEYDEVTVTAGTLLAVDLETALVSNGSHVEDAVYATTRKAVVVDGIEAIPAGTRIMGVVTEATPAGKVQGRARLAFSFNQLTYDSEPYRIETKRLAYTAQSTKKEDATKIGVGAAAGTLIGALAGGKKGAAVGAAVGGGAGTAVVLSTSGDEIQLPAGTDLSVELSSPVTITVPRSTAVAQE
jgi:outer membrane lipoprotein SlyB